MAHGKHRRTRGQSERNQRAVAMKAQLADQDHTMHDGDKTEMQFTLMACEHPGLCSCDSDYPNWKPGQR